MPFYALSETKGMAITMNNFYLANSSSINLNFLIYIHNLCENYHMSRNMPKFPWLPLQESVLLHYNEMNIRAKNLWESIFDSLYNEGEDLELWIHNKFPYYKLFKINSAGEKTYQDIKKSYESWYWATGKNILEIYSDNMVENYYNKLITMVEKQSAKLRDTKFYLQVVYNTPPIGWKSKNEKMIIISPEAELPPVEELYDLCSIF